MKKIIFLMSVLLLTSCLNIDRTLNRKLKALNHDSYEAEARFSSNHIGCASHEIHISNVDKDWLTGHSSWIATCKGKQYVCGLRPGAYTIYTSTPYEVKCSKRQ